MSEKQLLRLINLGFVGIEVDLHKKTIEKRVETHEARYNVKYLKIQPYSLIIKVFFFVQSIKIMEFCFNVFRLMFDVYEYVV